jgi:hypothetical protein
VVVLHPSELMLCLGPRHHQDCSRVEKIPYGYPGGVARILALLATVVA